MAANWNFVQLWDYHSYSRATGTDSSTARADQFSWLECLTQESATCLLKELLHQPAIACLPSSSLIQYSLFTYIGVIGTSIVNHHSGGISYSCTVRIVYSVVLGADRQSARMSIITNDCITRSCTGCYMATVGVKGLNSSTFDEHIHTQAMIVTRSVIVNLRLLT